MIRQKLIEAVDQGAETTVLPVEELVLFLNDLYAVAKHETFVRTPYTIAEIDDAMRAIAGEAGVRPGDWGWNRPHAMLNTASKAWIERRVEDKHTNILRSAILDMNETGCLRPHDGVWPERAA